MKIPKTSKGKRTRAKILETSINLINERGFQNLTLTDLRKASGVANGTFYHYFSSVTDLLKELIRQEIDDLETFYSNLDIPSSREKLTAMLRYQLEYFEYKGRDVFSAIYMSELKNGTKLIDPFSHATKSKLTEIIGEGQASGEFLTEFTPEFHADTILAILLYLSFQWILETKDTPLADIAFDRVLQEISRMTS